MGDTILLVLLFVVAPLCGLIGVFVRAFLWVFILVTLLVLAAMWLLRSFEPRGRAFISGILLVLSALALIAVIDLSPKKTVFPQYGDQATVPDNTYAAAGTQGVQGAGGAVASPTAPIDFSPTDGNAGSFAAPTNAPQDFSAISANVEPQTGGQSSEAQQALENYLLSWQQQDYEGMVQYTTPNWRAAQTRPSQQLYWNHSSWTLNNWTLSMQTGSAASDSAGFNVIANLTQNVSTKTPAVKEYTPIVFNVDGVWYVDPDSMRNGITVTETQAPNAAPTGSPQAQADPTTSPSLKLWYNPDGGSYYHLEQKCPDINEKYYNKMKSFKFSQLSDSPYSKLKPCPTCNAPKK